MERWVALRVTMRLTQCRLLMLAARIALKSAQMLAPHSAPQSAAQFARQRLAPSSNIKRCKETCGQAF